MNVLILGATSAIAEQVARIYAGRGASLLLVGRNPARLAALRDDMRVRGASRCETRSLDLDHVSTHTRLVDEADAALDGPIDIALLAHGVLGAPGEYAVSGEAAARVIHTNLVGPVSLLTLLAARMEVRGQGTLAAIGSVAGDRGRASNYAYGAAKGGLALFLQGLRNRLNASGVHVLTVKPGFVDTPMTANVPKTALFASPERVARDIVRAIDRRKDILYTPWFWSLIMFAVRALPERIFKKTRF